MSGLVVRFTRLNPTHHRFEAIREDGTRDQRELETRSLLTHDLIHFALESEAKLERFRAVRENTAARMPEWLTADLVARTTKRFRQLQGQWRATPFGQTMELKFEI